MKKINRSENKFPRANGEIEKRDKKYQFFYGFKKTETEEIKNELKVFDVSETRTMMVPTFIMPTV